MPLTFSLIEKAVNLATKVFLAGVRLIAEVTPISRSWYPLSTMFPRKLTL